MKDIIQATYHRLIHSLSITTHRYLYPHFHLKDRLTGLIGSRGVGKTTLMLQYIKEHLYADQKTLYFSADNIYFGTTTLLEFIHHCYLIDGTRIFFIDEVHKYSHWSQELKNIYDSFPDVNIVFSGSSSIDLIKGGGDLSRRAKLFHLHGLSFREYLNFSTNHQFPAITWDKLLHHQADAYQAIAQFPKIMGHFNDYLHRGYYPFLFENSHSYQEKIVRVIEKTIFEDIANYYSLKTTNLHAFKTILNYLATIPPGAINTHSIAKRLNMDDKTIFYYLTILRDTSLVRFVQPYAKGKQLLNKPEKIFLNNTTLHSVLNNYLGIKGEKGTIRELFFLQSIMNTELSILTNDYVDFQVGNDLFEIGGKNKTTAQLQSLKSSCFLVKDNILMSSKNTIPLFYFGFLY